MTTVVQLDLFDELDALTRQQDSPPWPTRQDGLRLDLRPEQYNEVQARFMAGVLAHSREQGWRWYYGWEHHGWDSNPVIGAHPWLVYQSRVDDQSLVQALTGEREVLRETCQNVRYDLYRTWCTTCEGWGGLHESSTAAINAHLDDHYTGWRDLPLLCPGSRPDQKRWTIPTDYPAEWVAKGLPFRECRHSRYSGRGHMLRANESPWKGTPMFTVGVINPNCEHYQHHPEGP